MVSIHNSFRERHKLTRSAILSPESCAWRHLLQNGDEQSFLELTGFNKQTFNALVLILFDDHDTNLFKFVME